MKFFRLCLALSVFLFSFSVLAMEKLPEELPEGLRHRKQPTPTSSLERDEGPCAHLPSDVVAVIISHLDQDDRSIHCDVANLRETSKLFYNTIENICRPTGGKYPKHILAPEKDTAVPPHSSSARPWLQACGALVPLSYVYELGCTWSGCGCMSLSLGAWFGIGKLYDVVMAPAAPKSKFAEGKVFTSLEDGLFGDKRQRYLVSGKVIKGIFEKYEAIKSLDKSSNLTLEQRKLILGERDEDIYGIEVTSLWNRGAIKDRALFEAFVSYEHKNEGGISFRWYPWGRPTDLNLSYQYEY